MYSNSRFNPSQAIENASYPARTAELQRSEDSQDSDGRTGMRQTAGVSLDDVMRLIFAHFHGENGFTTQDVERLASEVWAKGFARGTRHPGLAAT
jgi:hypothetical protein